MASVSADLSELNTLAADLTSASLRTVLRAVPVVAKGATNVKNQMRAEMQASDAFKGAASSISYDLSDGGLTAEIGPVTGPGGTPGDLAHIAYFGGSHGGGGTVADPIRALEVEAPKFEKAIADLLGGIL